MKIVTTLVVFRNPKAYLISTSTPVKPSSGVPLAAVKSSVPLTPYTEVRSYGIINEQIIHSHACACFTEGAFVLCVEAAVNSAMANELIQVA